MGSRYGHLGLTDWPFHVVPVESAFSFQADRHVLRTEITALLRNLSRRSGSSAHLMWAWYGSGKTHALRHIEQRCRQEYGQSIVPVYLEFPRGTRGFLDLYREFVLRLPPEVLDEGYLEITTSPARTAVANQLKLELPDLMNGLKLHYMGSPDQQEIVRGWLLTDIKDAKTLRTVGLNRSLASVEDCVKTLSWLLKIVGVGVGAASLQVDRRVLWMIDEFQRIQSCRRPAQDEINGALTSVFNRSPNFLSVIMSFSGRPSSRLPEWLSKDLADRIGIEKVMLLPPLTTDDAHKFIEDVIAHYRTPGFRALGFPADAQCFPFLREAVTAIISEASRKTELKPRALIHFFNAVLEEAEPLIEEGKLPVINAQFASSTLKDRVYLEHEE